jgi:hypothetical protein
VRLRALASAIEIAFATAPASGRLLGKKFIFITLWASGDFSSKLSV